MGNLLSSNSNNSNSNSNLNSNWYPNHSFGPPQIHPSVYSSFFPTAAAPIPIPFHNPNPNPHLYSYPYPYPYSYSTSPSNKFFSIVEFHLFFAFFASLLIV